MIFHSFLYVYQRVVTFKVDELWAFPFGLLHNIRYQSTNSQDDPLSSDLYQANIWFGEDCKSLNISKNNNNNIWYNYKYIMYVGVYIYIYIHTCAWVVPKARDRTIPHSPSMSPPWWTPSSSKLNQPPQFGEPNQRWLRFAPFSTRMTRLLSSCAKMLLAFGWPEAVPIFFSAGGTEVQPQSGSENFLVVAPPDPATHLASFSTIQGDNPACEAKKKQERENRWGWASELCTRFATRPRSMVDISTVG